MLRWPRYACRARASIPSFANLYSRACIMVIMQAGDSWYAMLETDKSFAGSIPENYDGYMVPLIFERYAADIAGRAGSLSADAVLETAAGSGVVTRALAPRLSRGASYVVTDLNQPMINDAASRQPPDSRIKWHQADALALYQRNAHASTVPSVCRAACRNRATGPLT